MFDDLTWDAILQAWPWFGAAGTVFFVAVGLFIAFKAKTKRQPEKAADDADNMEWTVTRRIDFADHQLAGAFVLQVEESRISKSQTGVEHREIRWRRATLPEAKMILESYYAQRYLAMSGTFIGTAPVGTKQKVNGQAESVEAELDVGNGQNIADVTLVPQDAIR